MPVKIKTLNNIDRIIDNVFFMILSLLI